MPLQESTPRGVDWRLFFFGQITRVARPSPCHGTDPHRGTFRVACGVWPNLKGTFLGTRKRWDLWWDAVSPVVGCPYSDFGRWRVSDSTSTPKTHQRATLRGLGA